MRYFIPIPGPECRGGRRKPAWSASPSGHLPKVGPKRDATLGRWVPRQMQVFCFVERVFCVAQSDVSASVVQVLGL